MPFTADAAEAERSLHKLSLFDFDDLYPSHGAPSHRQALQHLLVDGGVTVRGPFPD